MRERWTWFRRHSASLRSSYDHHILLNTDEACPSWSKFLEKKGRREDSEELSAERELLIGSYQTKYSRELFYLIR